MKNFYKVYVPLHHDELGNEVFIAANDMQEVLEILSSIKIFTNQIESIEFLGRGYQK